MSLALNPVELSLILAGLVVALLHLRLGIICASIRVLPKYAEHYFTVGLLSLSWVVFWTVLGGTEKTSPSLLGWSPLLFCGYLAPALYLFVQSFFYAPSAHPFKFMSFGSSGTLLSIVGLISGNTFVLMLPNQASTETNALLIFNVLTVIYLGQLGVFLSLTVFSLLKAIYEKHPYRQNALWFLGGLSPVIIFLYLAHGGINPAPFLVVLCALSTIGLGHLGYRALLSRHHSQEELCRNGNESQVNQIQKKIKEIRILNHQFNNYLATIVGNAELLKIKLGPSDPNLKYIDRIIGISDLSNTENKTRKELLFSDHWKPINVIEHIREILTKLNSSITIRSEHTDLLVNSSPTLFKKGIEPVVLNAIETDTTVTIEIKTEILNTLISVDKGSLQLGQNYIQILISDTGPSIPIKLKHRMWEPYFSTKPEHIGMGLTEVSDFLMQIDGACQIHSDKRGRNLFVIWIPIPKAEGAI